MWLLLILLCRYKIATKNAYQRCLGVDIPHVIAAGGFHLSSLSRLWVIRNWEKEGALRAHWRCSSCGFLCSRRAWWSCSPAAFPADAPPSWRSSRPSWPSTCVSCSAPVNCVYTWMRRKRSQGQREKQTWKHELDLKTWEKQCVSCCPLRQS